MSYHHRNQGKNTVGVVIKGEQMSKEEKKEETKKETPFKKIDKATLDSAYSVLTSIIKKGLPETLFSKNCLAKLETSQYWATKEIEAKAEAPTEKK